MKLEKLIPGCYCALALLAWADFSRLPADGLANAGLMLVVLPVTLVDLALRRATSPGSSVLMPSGFGYYLDHAIFFAVSVLLIAAALWCLGSSLDRRRAAKAGRDA